MRWRKLPSMCSDHSLRSFGHCSDHCTPCAIVLSTVLVLLGIAMFSINIANAYMEP
ncbi:hypothetical protein BCR37DRAFT_382980 [Protomyces lactucae-debilis]|uniref:Uncharacterized protein n=1 Tax=Protomyces lactucae-debilis TaxID=2754530 RepID=A0A1Y2EZF9_PROLT|nr:uncharacterized protein BCR37DRAFT_382980 [Protomyces lactucae-debilis]ORY76988.1 hypothetical protein BCR37DRAFT_382980 [Protomyces lactucae-debilis]